MTDDAQLLLQYHQDRSEAAFAEFVRRQIDFVYSVALRQVHGDAALAQDVVQTVFATVAQKAGTLAGRPVLGGWLYRATQFAAIDAVRAESRRRAREQEAQTMHLNEPETPGPFNFDSSRPLLDRAIGELGTTDRDAVVLRFFEGCSYAAIGHRLRLTENAARMRVERAQDKLRERLAREGVTSTAAALAAALAQSGIVAAPVGLAATVTGTVLAGSGGVAAIAATSFMAMTKLQMGIAAAFAVAGVGGFLVQSQANAALHREVATLQRGNQAAAQRAGNPAFLTEPSQSLAAPSADQAELARLQQEAATLRTQLGTVIVPRANYKATGPSALPYTGPYFESHQVDQPPRPVSQARPIYPPELRTLGVEGKATLSFVVDAEGNVRNAVCTRVTNTAFAAAALEAVTRWQFEPAQKEGRAVAMRFELPMTFEMGSSTKPKKSRTPALKTLKSGTVVPWF